MLVPKRRPPPWRRSVKPPKSSVLVEGLLPPLTLSVWAVTSERSVYVAVAPMLKRTLSVPVGLLQRPRPE